MGARRPDLIWWTKRRNHASSLMLLYQLIVGHVKIEKIEKYQDLKRDLKRLWSLKNIEVVPVIVGFLGCISKGFSGWTDTHGIKWNVGMIRKSVLLGTARILRKVLDM